MWAGAGTGAGWHLGIFFFSHQPSWSTPGPLEPTHPLLSCNSSILTLALSWFSRGQPPSRGYKCQSPQIPLHSHSPGGGSRLRSLLVRCTCTKPRPSPGSRSSWRRLRRPFGSWFLVQLINPEWRDWTGVTPSALPLDERPEAPAGFGIAAWPVLGGMRARWGRGGWRHRQMPRPRGSGPMCSGITDVHRSGRLALSRTTRFTSYGSNLCRPSRE